MTNCLSMENLSKLKIISHLNHSIVVEAHKSSSCHTKWEPSELRPGFFSVLARSQWITFKVPSSCISAQQSS